MSFIERLRAPGARALRDAGPPTVQVVLAFVAAGVVDLFLAVASSASLPWYAYVATPVMLTLAVSVGDRDGWIARRAIAYIGIEQRRRSGTRGLPATPEAADRWLADPATADAPVLVRVSALITSGRYADARDALRGFVPSDAVDEVRAIRLRGSIAAAIDPEHAIDIEAIRSASRSLPRDEARYQVVSAAWTRAWLDLSRRRPWRAPFVEVAREEAPFRLPVRVAAILTIQQLAAPIATVLAAVIVAVVFGRTT